MWELLDDLRDMGESNAIIGRWALHNRFVFHAKLMIYSSRHLLHRDTLAAASAIYKGMVESYSLGALTTWTSRAPWTRGWHRPSYVPGHLSSQLHLLSSLSSHSQCKRRLGGNLHRSSQSRWRGARAKRTSKISSSEEGETITPASPQPYSRFPSRWGLHVQHRPEICALV